MDAVTLAAAIGVAGVLLFFWTGFAQAVLLWGVKSVGRDSTGSLGSSIAATTTNSMLFIKDQVAAFVVVRPESYYAMGRYFAIEFVGQLVTAAVLVGILALTPGLADPQRLLLVVLVAVAGMLSIDLQYWNWWGFSTRYTLGMAFNRLVGYLLASGVLLTWFL